MCIAHTLRVVDDCVCIFFTSFLIWPRIEFRHLFLFSAKQNDSSMYSLWHSMFMHKERKRERVRKWTTNERKNIDRRGFDDIVIIEKHTWKKWEKYSKWYSQFEMVVFLCTNTLFNDCLDGYDQKLNVGKKEAQICIRVPALRKAIVDRCIQSFILNHLYDACAFGRSPQIMVVSLCVCVDAVSIILSFSIEDCCQCIEPSFIFSPFNTFQTIVSRRFYGHLSFEWANNSNRSEVWSIKQNKIAHLIFPLCKIYRVQSDY